MPYIHVIEGKSASISSSDPYEVRNSVTDLEAYKALVAKADHRGVKVAVTPNIDDSEVVFLVGKDLYRYKHIFQGCTVTLDGKATADELDFVSEVFSELEVILNELGLEFVVDQGIVVSQFD